MSTRINARLEPALAAKVDEVRRRTGMSLTEIVEAALREWTEKVSRKKPNPAQGFEESGFIGSGSGPRDLAENVKQELGRTLQRKK